jgi:hypothetical protein
MQIRRTCWAAAAGLLLSGLLVFMASVVAVAQAKDGFAPAALLTPPSMNVFRRFAVDRSKMMEFYGGVLALKPMPTLAMPGGGQMTRFQVGTSEIKLTTAAQGSRPISGGVREVTGLFA